MGSAQDTATFGIELQTDGTVNPAKSAADAVERLTKKLDEDTQALSGMQRALRNLKPGGMVAEAQITKLKLAIKAQQQTIAGTQSRVLTLGGSFRRLKPPVNDASKALDTLLQKLQGTGGPLASAGSGFTKLRGLLSGGALVGGTVLFAAALVAVAAGLVAVTVATLAAVAAVSKFALVSADAYRVERLQLEGLVRLRNWYGLAADKASFLQQQIDRVSASSSLGRSEINGLAREFYGLNLRGGNLQAALEGGAIALATQGQAGLAQFKAMALGARMFGKSIRDVTNDFKARLGPIARAQMLSLDVQSVKLRESLSQLFRDVRITPVLEALHEFTQLLSQNTYTGRALKNLIDHLFSPFGASVSTLGPLVKRFFQGMVLGALQLATSFFLVRNALRKAFGGGVGKKEIDSQRKAFQLGTAAIKFFGTTLVSAVAVCVLALGYLAATATAMTAPFRFMTKTIAQAAHLVIDVFLRLKNFNWVQLGLDIMAGFVNGIMRGYEKVKNAVLGLRGIIKGALKSATESNSPSKLSERISASLPQGVVVAQKKGEPMVARATERLGDVATASFRVAMGDFEVPRPKTTRIPRAGDTMRAKPSVFGASIGRDSQQSRLEIAPAVLSMPQPPRPRVGNTDQRPTLQIGELNLHFGDSEPRDRAEQTREEIVRMLSELNVSLGGSDE